MPWYFYSRTPHHHRRHFVPHHTHHPTHTDFMINCHIPLTIGCTSQYTHMYSMLMTSCAASFYLFCLYVLLSQDKTRHLFLLSFSSCLHLTYLPTHTQTYTQTNSANKQTTPCGRRKTRIHNCNTTPPSLTAPAPVARFHPPTRFKTTTQCE